MRGFMKLHTFLLGRLVSLLLITAIDGSSLRPPVLPLVVRNPYLNVHLSSARDVPWKEWPMFWTGQSVGLSVLARVPESRNVYPLLGRPHDSLSPNDEANYKMSLPQYLGAQFDASTTNFTYRIHSTSMESEDSFVELTLSFISPVTPTSTLRQSLPASYFEVTANGDFNVEIYVDVNGMWVTGNEDSTIEWQMKDIRFENMHPLWSWRVHRQIEMKFAEEQDRAEYGHMHFTALAEGSFGAGSSSSLRNRFARHGSLRNRIDTNFRKVKDHEPVFAFQKTLNLSIGPKHNTERASRHTAKALFTIAHTRDDLVQYASASGLKSMKPLWHSYLSSDAAMIMYHFSDYLNTTLMSNMYSEQLYEDAMASGGQNYADIVSISVRQVLGATDFSGTPEKPLIFVKEISSNGNAQTIDIIYPMSLFFMYTNPTWLEYILDPLLEHMLSGQYPNEYAMHDLGSHYPNLTGHPLGRDEYMPVEECGNMLIMGAALVRLFERKDRSSLTSVGFGGHPDSTSSPGASRNRIPTTLRAKHDFGEDPPEEDILISNRPGDESPGKLWLQKSYKLWDQWTQYLVRFALKPENQLSTDDFAGWLPLQTNLALKGIIGIKAMSELAAVMGDSDGSRHYKNLSSSYIRKWQMLGLSRDYSHAKLAYHWYGSWTTLYSLFADALLCFHAESSSSTFSSPSKMNSLQEPMGSSRDLAKPTGNFIPQGIYANQSSWYALSMQKYGLPLDSRHLYAKIDWEFQAAAVASPAVRHTIIKRIARWLNETETNRPFTDWYDTEGYGGFGGGDSDAKFIARPVVGSSFSLIVMQHGACEGQATNGLEIWNEEYHEQDL